MVKTNSRIKSQPIIFKKRVYETPLDPTKRQKVSEKLNILANFSYIPDPSLYQGGTWREEELLGHNSFAYPAAELIDNSLMATKDNSERKINIKIISVSGGEMVLVVSDNGKGMDITGLQNLAVFAHAPMYRDDKSLVLDTKETKKIRYLNSLISKFGVGLKNAAFHIGDDLVVITKTKNSPNVLEFNMNISTMRNKYKERREKAYEGAVYQRAPGEIERSLISLRRKSHFVEKVISEEKGKNHFTTILISSNGKKSVQKLRYSNYRLSFAKNLASIYHYYLNGVYGKSANEEQRNHSPKLTNANITLEFLDESKSYVEKIDLRELDDAQTLYHKMYKGTPFQFELELPNKDPVIGVIYYYPFVNDGETVPCFDGDGENNNRNFKRDSQNNIFEPIFSCFWQGRQIPFTKVSILNFMGTVEPYLRRRIRGSLFFNESFAVNPQKNIFNDNLDEILNVKEAKIKNMIDDLNKKPNEGRSKRARTKYEKSLTVPKKRFIMWVKRMSLNFDKEIGYFDESEIKVPNGSRAFKKVIYSNQQFRTGDLVKIQATGKNVHFGIIICFHAKDNCDGNVRYHRIPKQVFGKEEYNRLTRDIFKNVSMAQIEKEYKEEEKRILEKYPSFLHFDFDTGEYEDIEFPPKKKVSCGYFFPDCYIKILGRKSNDGTAKSLTSILLGENKKRMVLVITQTLERYDMKNMMWMKDQKANGLNAFECPPLQSKYHSKGTYYFRPLQINTPGLCRITFRAKVKGQKDFLVSRRFEMDVSIGAPKILKISKINLQITAGDVNEFKSTAIPLEIVDIAGNSLAFNEKLLLLPKIRSGSKNGTEVKVETKKSDDLFKVTVDAKYYKKIHRYCIFNFKAIPLKDVKIPLEGLELTMRLEVKINEYKEVNSDIILKILPGVPKKIKMYPKLLKVKNRCFLKNVCFVLEDQYGNETASLFKVNNLIFKIPKNTFFKPQLKSVCERRKNKFFLQDLKISVQWNKIPLVLSGGKEEIARSIELPFTVFSRAEINAEQLIPLNSSLKVTANEDVQRVFLCNSLDKIDIFQTQKRQELNIKVGKISIIFLVFLNELGQKIKNVRRSDIINFKTDPFSEKIYELKEDKNGNIIIELALPKKIEGNRNCSIKCSLKNNPGVKLKHEFKITPMYGEPVKWDLHFPDTILSGSKIENSLAVWLADEYGNRINVNDFESPLETKPNLISSCTVLNANFAIDSRRGCYYCPKGEMKGQEGYQTIQIEENGEYEFKASNKHKFYMMSGYPCKLATKVYSESKAPSRGEKVGIYSCDVIVFQVRLEDSYGNKVNSGNYEVIISIPGDMCKEEINKKIPLKNGSAEGKIHFVAKSSTVESSSDANEKPGIEMTFELDQNSKQRMFSVKTLRVLPTPLRITKILVTPSPPPSSKSGDKTTQFEVNQFPPDLEFLLKFEDCKENQSEKLLSVDLDLGSFSVKEFGPEQKESFFGRAERRGGKLVFRPVRRFKEVGVWSFFVIHSEARRALPGRVSSKRVCVVVDSGTPYGLKILNLAKLENLSAGNMGDCRLLAKCIEVGVVDSSGNEIKDYEKKYKKFPTLILDVLSKDISIDINDLPKVKYESEANKVNFVRIAEATGNLEGNLLLSIKPVDCPFPLLPVKIPFFFSNDSKRVSTQRTLETEKTQIDERIASVLELLKPCNATKERMAVILEKTREFEAKHKMFKGRSREQSDTLLNLKISALKREIEKNTLDSSLPVFKSPLTSMDGYIGRLGELISVENPGIARCVMYLLGSKLNVHLTKGANSRVTKESTRYLKKDKNFSFLDIDLLPNRSFETVLKGGRLPHEGHFYFVGDESKGPSYAVSNLRMRNGLRCSKAEFERVFVYFLSNHIIMKNLETAIEYERRCVERKIYGVKIVTTDGFHVQLVKHSIPSFKQMRDKRRGIAVFPSKMVAKLKFYKEVLIPEMKDFYELKEEEKKIVSESKVLGPKKVVLENELEGLQKKRLFLLKEMKTLIEGAGKSGSGNYGRGSVFD